MMSARYIRILSCTAVLAMYLNTAHAAAHVSNALIINEMKANQFGQAVANAGGSTTIKGTVVRVEYDAYLVRGNNGREVHVAHR